MHRWCRLSIISVIHPVVCIGVFTWEKRWIADVVGGRYATMTMSALERSDTEHPPRSSLADSDSKITCGVFIQQQPMNLLHLSRFSSWLYFIYSFTRQLGGGYSYDLSWIRIRFDCIRFDQHATAVRPPVDDCRKIKHVIRRILVARSKWSRIDNRIAERTTVVTSA